MASRRKSSGGDRSDVPKRSCTAFVRHKVCTCRENHGGGGLVPSTTSGVLGCICYRHGGTTAQRAGQTGSWELRISVTGVDGHLCLSSVGHPPRSAYRTLRPGHRGLSSSFRQKWVLLCRSRLAYSVPWPQHLLVAGYVAHLTECWDLTWVAWRQRNLPAPFLDIRDNYVIGADSGSHPETTRKLALG